MQGEINPRFSSPHARAAEWAHVRQLLTSAEIYWLATVRTDGQPHVTPLIGIWTEDAFHFCTGADERKALNLRRNDRATVSTGCNVYGVGTDVVVEGRAALVADHPLLERLAAAFVEKYGDDWRFIVRDGLFVGTEGNEALVFKVTPAKAFGFTRGASFAQTRFVP
jgi:general stress protein 26